MMRPRLQHRDVGGDGGAVLSVVAVNRDCGEDLVQVHLHDVRVAIHRARVEQRRCSRHGQRRQRQPMREEGVLIGRGVAAEACMETLGLEEHELEERALPPRHLLERLRRRRIALAVPLELRALDQSEDDRVLRHTCDSMGLVRARAGRRRARAPPAG